MGFTGLDCSDRQSDLLSYLGNLVIGMGKLQGDIKEGLHGRKSKAMIFIHVTFYCYRRLHTLVEGLHSALVPGFV
jgi:hypothetical protein